MITRYRHKGDRRQGTQLPTEAAPLRPHLIQLGGVTLDHVANLDHKRRGQRTDPVDEAVVAGGLMKLTVTQHDKMELVVSGGRRRGSLGYRHRQE